MRKLLLILMGMMALFPSLVEAEVVKEWSVHNDLEDFGIEEYGGRVYVTTIFKEETFDLAMAQMIEYDKPALPKMVYTAMTKDNQDEIVSSNVEVLSRVLVMDNVELGIQGDLFNFEFVHDSSLIQNNYLDIKVKVNDSGRSVVLEVFPFEYDATSKALYFTSDIRLTLLLKSSDEAFKDVNLPIERRSV